ncbi:MAG TPA: hypothetical protein PKC13_23395 [Blastocatellia bacterium]|nr:hypothetical protein [Blastocatellia bacterium]HMX28552.1 hypothetical protein [Blastocatellia bacterium]HMY70607.1 hypothetical protein [Blastocatellia bacterium]HNG31396.1 hypothetical protein [Blastocatellia bacterium]
MPKLFSFYPLELTMKFTERKIEKEHTHKAVSLLSNDSPELYRLSLLRQACGIWKDRDDLPDLRELRAELDRKHFWPR